MDDTFIEVIVLDKEDNFIICLIKKDEVNEDSLDGREGKVRISNVKVYIGNPLS